MYASYNCRSCVVAYYDESKYDNIVINIMHPSIYQYFSTATGHTWSIIQNLYIVLLPCTKNSHVYGSSALMHCA